MIPVADSDSTPYYELSCHMKKSALSLVASMVAYGDVYAVRVVV